MGHEHSHRAPKTTAGWEECWLLAAVAVGATALVYSYSIHHVRTRAGDEFVTATRYGGGVLFVVAAALLLGLFARRWLAEARATWEVKRQARRAVLITPAPVIARLEAMEAAQAEAAARQEAADAERRSLIEAFKPLLKEAGYPMGPDTVSMPKLWLAASDGEIVSDEKDSA